MKTSFSCTAPEVQKAQWILFNDFRINTTAESEAIRFDSNWKRPNVIFFAKSCPSDEIIPSSAHSLSEHDSTTTPQEKLLVDENMFMKPLPVLNTSPDYENVNPSHLTKNMEPLFIPKAGDLIAIDTEFVSLSEV